MNIGRRLMTPDEFLDWCQEQEERFELVNGQPRMMTGATRRHDRLVVNIIAHLHQALRGKPCQPNTADIATRIPAGNVRRPDVTVDCGTSPDDSLEAEAPTAVFEVLSPSTQGIDLIRKAEEYKTIPSLRHMVLFEPETALVAVWSRGDQAEPWEMEEHTSLGATALLAALEVSLPLATIYEGVTLAAAPNDG